MMEYQNATLIGQTTAAQAANGPSAVLCRSSYRPKREAARLRQSIRCDCSRRKTRRCNRLDLCPRYHRSFLGDQTREKSQTTSHQVRRGGVCRGHSDAKDWIGWHQLRVPTKPTKLHGNGLAIRRRVEKSIRSSQIWDATRRIFYPTP